MKKKRLYELLEEIRELALKIKYNDLESEGFLRTILNHCENARIDRKQEEKLDNS
jgi:hypothetical protein